MNAQANYIHKTVDFLAESVIGQPLRLAEAKLYQRAIIETLNNTHANFEQDALCVFEAIANVLGQLTANLSPDERNGIAGYVSTRMLDVAPAYQIAGTGARHRTEDQADS